MICRLCSAVLALAVAAAPLAGAAAGEHPARTIVRSASSARLSAVELWFRAPSAGFAEPLAGLAQLTAESVAASAGRREPLAVLVQDVGGRLQITTFPDAVQITAVVPAAAAAEIARAAFYDYVRPTLTPDGFKRARESVAVEAAAAGADPDAQLRARLFGALFERGPDRYAALPAVQQLDAITYPEVVAFAKRAFRAENTIAVVTGAPAGDAVMRAFGGQAAGVPAEAALISVPASAPPNSEGESAAGPAFGMAFAGPPIEDQRAATAMDFLADYLLGGRYGSISRALRAQVPDADAVGQFITLHDPGILLLEVTGDASPAVRDVVEHALAAVQRPLETQAFEAARREYIYHVLRDLQSVQAQADNLGWYAVEGSPEYAPLNGGEQGEYLTLARSLTPEYVAEIARKYLRAVPAVATLSAQTPAQASGAGAR
ncbi:insulinase family protein [bacterium]|nr:MAG: insulinase family protein [bacterium]